MTEDEYSDHICRLLKARNRGYEHGERVQFSCQILVSVLAIYLTIRYLV